MRKWLMTTAGLALVLPAAALGIPAPVAENGPIGQPSSSGPVIDGGMGWGAMRLFLGLGIVIALICAIAWFVRKRQGIQPRVRGSLPGLEVLGTVPLAPNRAIHALRMGDEVVLVAMGEGAATVIGRRIGEDAASIIGRPLIDDRDPLAIQMESSLKASRKQGGMAARLRQITVRP